MQSSERLPPPPVAAKPRKDMQAVRRQLKEVESQLGVLKSASQVISVNELVKGTYKAFFHKKHSGSAGIHNGLPLGQINETLCMTTDPSI
jgi:hypothetical protein